jgi:hypothetical protein
MGVSGSQLKFLEGTCPMSQIQPDVPPFQLGQDHIAIGKLLVIDTGLGPLNQSGSTNRCTQNTFEPKSDQLASHSLSIISSITL